MLGISAWVKASCKLGVIVNLVPYIRDHGSFTLTSIFLAEDPIRHGANITCFSIERQLRLLPL